MVKVVQQGNLLTKEVEFSRKKLQPKVFNCSNNNIAYAIDKHALWPKGYTADTTHKKHEDNNQGRDATEPAMTWTKIIHLSQRWGVSFELHSRVFYHVRHTYFLQ